MCHCDPSIRTPYCGKWGCGQPYIHTTGTDSLVNPYVITPIKTPAIPIHAESMDKVPNTVIEYLNKAIQVNWDGDKAKINVETAKAETKLSINYQKICDLFCNYGWGVDYKTTEGNEWFVFTIRK